MKCLVTGARGQLGYDLIKELEANNHEVIGLGHTELDVTNFAQVYQMITLIRPDVVFHCAAYTKVDKAEEETEALNCYLINTIGTYNIRLACQQVDCKLMYISTDYVYDGKKNEAYQTNDKTCPLNIYGKSKRYGEMLASDYSKTFIVRISWVFGKNGNNFIKTMLKLAQTRDELNVICDQIGSPTYTVDVSRLLVDIATSSEYGIYHATNEGSCSWADLAEYVFQINNLNVKVNRIPTKDYPQAAKRPLNSVLDKAILDERGFKRLPDWHDAVDRFNEELINEKVLKK